MEMSNFIYIHWHVFVSVYIAAMFIFESVGTIASISCYGFICLFSTEHIALSMYRASSKNRQARKGQPIISALLCCLVFFILAVVL